MAAATFPLVGLIEAAGISGQSFKLEHRSEISRDQNGRTYVKRRGSPIWRASWTVRPKRHEDAVAFEALINLLDGGQNTFYAYDVRKPYPRAYPTGVFNDTGEIGAIDADNKRISLKNLDPNFEISRGDRIAFDYGAGPSRALHEISEDVTADGSGVTALFEIRPHLRPGLAVDDAVVFKKPSAIFALDPGSFESETIDTLFSGASFSAYQAL